MGIPVTASLSKEDRVRVDELIKVLKSFGNKEIRISLQDKDAPSVEVQFGASGIQTIGPKHK